MKFKAFIADLNDRCGFGTSGVFHLSNNNDKKNWHK